jgi:cytochrome P450
VLLRARAQDGGPLTDGEICDEAATFMLAGHETSANAPTWSLALLSAYPAARERLEGELAAVLPDRDPAAADAAPLTAAPRCRHHQARARAMACKARPTPAPTTVPLMRMNCRSRPRSSSSWLEVSAASHLSMVPVTRPASSSWN